MGDGSKWSPGKIFLVVIAVIAGLGLLCCGGIWIVAGDKIVAGIHFATNSGKFVLALQNDFGKTAIFGLVPNDKQEFILTIGAEGDLTPERVVQIQDGAWKTYGNVFAQDGFFPVKYLAVGRPMKNAAGQGGAVVDWSKNMIAVEELVKRTGVAAPPMVKFLPEDAFKQHIQIKVEASDDEKTKGEPKTDDTKKDVKEGGGGGADGK